MDENKIREIANQVYQENQAKNQNTTFVVPKHIHNGVDSPRVSQDNIESGTYAVVNLISSTSETFTIETFPNIDHLTIYGIAADGLGRKSIINGVAFIGNCFAYENGSGSYINLKGQYSNIIQSCNSAYFDTTGAFDTTDVRVNAAGSIGTGGLDALIYVKDNVNEVATMKIVSWTNNTITFKTTLAANWYVNFYLSMS